MSAATDVTIATGPVAWGVDFADSPNNPPWELVLDEIASSGVLALVPGPNLVAYYCAFRVVGHLQSWRGARGAGQIAWTCASDTSLAELAELAAQPRETRRPRVAEIAAHLHLQRLPKFFERVAV